jgi:hypothetical protein
MKYIALTMALTTAALSQQPAELPRDKVAALVKHTSCSMGMSFPNISLGLDRGPMPYQFAKAVLVSLFDAHAAIKDPLKELTEAQEKDLTPFGLLAAVMRGNKLSTNAYVCAQRSITNFIAEMPTMKAGPGDKKWIETQHSTLQAGADLLKGSYYTQILINMRVLQLLNQLGDKNDMTKLMDTISTLEVERGQRFDDLLGTTTTALMLLRDITRPDEQNHISRLIITRAQGLRLVDWVKGHFPELSDGTSKVDKPAQTAGLYLSLNDPKWKYADEKHK